MFSTGHKSPKWLWVYCRMSGGDSTDLSLSPVGEALRVCVSGRLGVWCARGLFVSKLHLKFGDELSDSQSLSLFVCVCVLQADAVIAHVTGAAGAIRRTSVKPVSMPTLTHPESHSPVAGVWLTDHHRYGLMGIGQDFVIQDYLLSCLEWNEKIDTTLMSAPFTELEPGRG